MIAHPLEKESVLQGSFNLLNVLSEAVGTLWARSLIMLAGKVLAATDFSDLALPAVEAGAAEARHRKADLTIIHAIDLTPVMSPFYGEFYDVPPIDLSDQMRKIWQQRLDECVHQFKAKGGGLLRDGPAAPAILRPASELPAQLLVLGTHGRTGLSRIALGSVAEAVVRAAPCSVLIVRFV